MLLFGRHLLPFSSVLDVDVNPPIGIRFGEKFGSSERLSAVGENGSAVLVLDGPLLAGVLISEDVIAVKTFQIYSPALLSGIAPITRSFSQEAPMVTRLHPG